MPNGSDNCPSVANPPQTNSNGEVIDLPPGIAFDDVSNPIALTIGDACNPDDDNDGLLDTEEAAAGTNAAMFDTDGDRQRDGAEVACGSNPLDSLSRVVSSPGNPDLDGDLLPVACEAIAGTDTGAGDSDGDEVLDGIEFLRVGTSAINANTDGDDCGDASEMASLNSDHTVNSIDLGFLASRYSLIGSPLYFWDFDVNRDGAINSLDLLFVALQFGAC